MSLPAWSISSLSAGCMDDAEYRKLAEVEDRMWYFRALHGHIERELTATLGSGFAEILDAGCGTGGLIARLAPRHPWSWTGIDVSDVALTYAKERVRFLRADLRQGSVTAMPFADGSFDAIVSADVLYHIVDDGKAMGEFARVLRPGGVVVLNLPAYRWLWSYHDIAVHSQRRYTRSDVIRLVQDAGLSPVRSTYWNTLPFPLIVLRRKLLPAPRGGSDVQLYPAPIEKTFDAAMAMERGGLRVFGRLPFGSSVFVVARKSQ